MVRETDSLVEICPERQPCTQVLFYSCLFVLKYINISMLALLVDHCAIIIMGIIIVNRLIVIKSTDD